ncbi:MAG: alcohol dehydrogenase catalytic domain-containing protein [Candidatus Rokubacteria bacterium]|nr:alcohol dehydrogenase catalytic domain-containing protein [Candidatus Rokubacteria bacterium]
MRAMLLHELAGPVKLGEVPVPEPGPNEVLIKVRATGVGLTVVIMKATPGLVTSYPRILGHELAGEVAETGSAVEGWRVGDRVTCHFYLTCKVCKWCRLGKETRCPNFKGYVGMACDGAYAEYLTLPAVNLCRIPATVSFLDACVAADAICTPYHACRAEAQIGPSDDVVIVGGGGGVGIHGVQMARLCGGRVIGVDLGDAKLQQMKACGADEVIDATAGDWSERVLRLTEGKGVEAVIDFVASRRTLETSMKCLGRMGRLVIIGHRPPAVFKELPDFTVNPLEVHS